MLVKLLTLALLIAAVVLLLSPAARAALRRRLPTLLLWGGLGALVLLVATGRISWIFAAVGGVAALARRALPLLLRAAPLLSAFRRQPAAAEPAPPMRVGAMSRDEALGVLGLGPEASREEIVAAHRRLMQRLHPDRGGTDALAARVNEAKATLLG